MKILVVTIGITLGLSFWNQIVASHNRSTELTYKCLDSVNFLKYEVTLTTYTRLDADDPCEVVIYFGDGDSSIATRSNGVQSGSNGCPGTTIPAICSHCGEYLQGGLFKKNIFSCVHTYASPGQYVISYLRPSRNAEVCNIANPISIPMINQALLVISPFLGINNSPVFANPYIEEACAGQIFRTNTFAYDPDGDSLVHTLVSCLGSNGLPIQNNPGNYNVEINPKTGMMTWDSPMEICSYNFAIKTEDWRFIGNDCTPYLMGYTIRDFVLDVNPGNNTKPELFSVIDSFDLLVGNSISFDINATDQDSDFLNLEIIFNPELVDFTQMQALIIEQGIVSYRVTVTSTYEKVRCEPYFFYIKTVDDGGINNNYNSILSDYKAMYIYIKDSLLSCPCSLSNNEDIIINKSILLPNPVSNSFTIQNTDAKSGRVVDLLGKSIFTFHFESGKAAVDALSLANGIYLVTLDNGQTLKFLVHR